MELVGQALLLFLCQPVHCDWSDDTYNSACRIFSSSLSGGSGGGRLAARLPPSLTACFNDLLGCRKEKPPRSVCCNKSNSSQGKERKRSYSVESVCERQVCYQQCVLASPSCGRR
uniref:Secreted protein n=1 Tax=Knipowitschia caucasica TaxID=637954 RepID=A0AAV2MA32_KNICA